MNVQSDYKYTYTYTYTSFFHSSSSSSTSKLANQASILVVREGAK